MKDLGKLILLVGLYIGACVVEAQAQNYDPYVQAFQGLANDLKRDRVETRRQLEFNRRTMQPSQPRANNPWGNNIYKNTDFRPAQPSQPVNPYQGW